MGCSWQEARRYEAELRDATERFRAELDAQTRLQIASMQGGGAESASQMSSITQALSAAIAELSRPKQIIRDASGRVAGVAPVPKEPMQ